MNVSRSSRRHSSTSMKRYEEATTKPGKHSVAPDQGGRADIQTLSEAVRRNVGCSTIYASPVHMFGSTRDCRQLAQLIWWAERASPCQFLQSPNLPFGLFPVHGNDASISSHRTWIRLTTPSNEEIVVRSNLLVRVSVWRTIQWKHHRKRLRSPKWPVVPGSSWCTSAQ